MVRVLILVLVLLAVPAQAHDWYPKECCSDGDCAPTGPIKIEPGPDGSYIINGQPIPRDRLRPSPDGDWHICKGRNSGFIFCVFKPGESF